MSSSGTALTPVPPASRSRPQPGDTGVRTYQKGLSRGFKKREPPPPAPRQRAGAHHARTPPTTRAGGELLRPRPRLNTWYPSKAKARDTPGSFLKIKNFVFLGGRTFLKERKHVPLASCSSFAPCISTTSPQNKHKQIQRSKKHV